MSRTHRSEMARLISPLRRVRPNVPFWKLPAHRIPTLWSLYRALLRTVPTDNIAWRVRCQFRQHKSNTSPSQTKLHLQHAHHLLEACEHARQGDQRLQLVLSRYDKILAFRRWRQKWIARERAELNEIHGLRTRPIMTGGYLRPSLYNPPLPRLSPQPLHITGMIVSRKAARARRLGMLDVLTDWTEDLQLEHDFECTLLQDVSAEGRSFEPIFKDGNTWLQVINEHSRALKNSNMRDQQRVHMAYTPEMLESIKEARREKIRNKTRERERERRGEVLPRTLLRRRKSPPAHILERMTPEQRMLDKAIRSPSEVGFVAIAKRRLGVKLQDNRTWQLEDGATDKQADLNAQYAELRRINRRRNWV